MEAASYMMKRKLVILYLPLTVLFYWAIRPPYLRWFINLFKIANIFPHKEKYKKAFTVHFLKLFSLIIDL